MASLLEMEGGLRIEVADAPDTTRRLIEEARRARPGGFVSLPVSRDSAGAAVDPRRPTAVRLHGIVGVKAVS